MNTLEHAKSILHEQSATCVLIKGAAIFTSQKKGVAPIMELIKSRHDLSGFTVADKVVGRAAAMLFIASGITELWTEVISDGAISMLDQYKIKYSYEKVVETILSPKGTICPLEIATENLTNPHEAYKVIYQLLENR